MKITHKISMDLDRYSVPGFDAVCGDRNTRELEIALYAGGQAWELPAEVSVSVRYQKPDGTGGFYDLLPDGSPAWEISGNEIIIVLAPQTLTIPGCVIMTVCLTAGERKISTFQILMNVRPAVGMVPADSGDYWYLSGSLPQPENAAVGEVLVVESVDSRGRVTALTTAGTQGLSPSQVSALKELLKLAVYREDPTDAWKVFSGAFSEAVPATDIALSSVTVALAAGATKQLTASVTPENSTDPVVWSSSDETVAKVAGGLVTPMGNGTCTVTAAAGNVSAFCTVTVSGIDDPIHNHSYTSAVTKAATCTAAGITTYTCQCGDSYTEAIPATGHSYVDGICAKCGAADPDHAVTVNHSITYNLINCTCSETTTQIGDGQTFTADILPNEGYTIGNASVTVTMGGADITYEAVAGDYICIEKVTGDVVITANGVPQEGTLLYNWDFTKSLTDTVSGLTATAEVTTKDDGCGEVPAQDASGVHFTGIGQAVGFGNIFALNRTYEIDIGEMDCQGPANLNVRFFTLWKGPGSDSVSGFLYRHTHNYWAVYSSGWAVNPFGITDRNAFAGKTVTLKIDTNGNTELLIDGVSKGVCTQRFSAGWPVLQLGSTAIDGNTTAATMGANLYHCTITGFRIYEGVA